MDTPIINIGILTDKVINFVFNAKYIHMETGTYLMGEQKALFENGKILFQRKWYNELFFEPATEEATFDLKAVTIGRDFHWQRKEDQRFKGSLNLVIDGDKGIVVINQIDIETYLTSVISSEMSATSSEALLKAHAVISRSWLLARIERKNLSPKEKSPNKELAEKPGEHIRWYGNEEHTLFDVCADDHCQRYQGITRAGLPSVAKAVQETCGEVLTDGITICDARFSKCCGGVTEQFESCWEPEHHSYLTAIRDNTDASIPNLTQEYVAREWICYPYSAFCNTKDKQIMSQILNTYDQETTNFFRWKQIYSQYELANLIRSKSGIDFGEILDLVPIERGTSGRIIKLRIVGSKQTLVIGKELEIRRILSKTHLYSSAFVVEKKLTCSDIPSHFILYGAGWGHGVGLCQIGAAVMGNKGYTYRQILSHYYPGTQLEKRY